MRKFEHAICTKERFHGERDPNEREVIPIQEHEKRDDVKHDLDCPALQDQGAHVVVSRGQVLVDELPAKTCQVGEYCKEEQGNGFITSRDDKHVYREVWQQHGNVHVIEKFKTLTY